MDIRRQIARLLTLGILGAAMVTLGCQSKPQNQQPSAEEQKKIEQEYQKSLEQERQLTSGYEKSMQSVPTTTINAPKNQIRKPPQAGQGQTRQQNQQVQSQK